MYVGNYIYTYVYTHLNSSGKGLGILFCNNVGTCRYINYIADQNLNFEFLYIKVHISFFFSLLLIIDRHIILNFT